MQCFGKALSYKTRDADVLPNLALLLHHAGHLDWR